MTATLESHKDSNESFLKELRNFLGSFAYISFPNMKKEQKGDTMSKMGDFVIEIGELYQERHPNASWEEAMKVVTSDDPESKELEHEVLRRRGIEA